MDEFLKNTYPAKLLLFGEYTVLETKQALAIPLTEYSGTWHLATNTVHNDLLAFAEYLEEVKLDGAVFRGSYFQSNVKQGLTFKSNIPMGAGLGSSGAISAAVYDCFFAKNQGLITKQHKSNLALIESYFHGNSSGIDPLISFLDKGVFVDDEETIPIETIKKGPYSLFIIDSKQSRSTKALVNRFQKMREESQGFQGSIDLLADLNLKAMRAFIHSSTDLMAVYREISTAQLDLLSEFIPDHIQSIWSKGLQNNAWYMKLCGAGGGGFFQGISVSGELPENGIRIY